MSYNLLNLISNASLNISNKSAALKHSDLCVSRTNFLDVQKIVATRTSCTCINTLAICAVSDYVTVHTTSW